MHSTRERKGVNAMPKIYRKETYTGPLPKEKHIDAITWAASAAGTSYGRYIQHLTPQEKEKIYNDYQNYLHDRFSPKVSEKKSEPFDVLPD